MLLYEVGRDDLVGTRSLTTPSGNILKELFKGIKLGISSRGLGSVETIKFEEIEQIKLGMILKSCF